MVRVWQSACLCLPVFDMPGKWRLFPAALSTVCKTRKFCWQMFHWYLLLIQCVRVAVAWFSCPDLKKQWCSWINNICSTYSNYAEAGRYEVRIPAKANFFSKKSTYQPKLFKRYRRLFPRHSAAEAWGWLFTSI